LKRDLTAYGGREFDVVIVGGGVTGACVARDAAMRGLSVALLEKKDFSSATSGASSKLIHGGIRYLRNLEFGLVRESLRERRNWANNAPHMVQPLGVLLPTHGRGKHGRAAIGTYFTVYDLLAYDRNRLMDPSKRLPTHRSFSRAEVRSMVPGLEETPVTGGKMFFDYQMHSPERLLLECLQDAASHGACIANYAKVTAFHREGGAITGVGAEDLLGGTGRFDVGAKVVVNAAGPWADLLMGAIEGGIPSRNLVRSKGIHLITRPLVKDHGVAIDFGSGHFFIVPWRGHSLIGTTDTVYAGDPDAFAVTEDDIAAFLDVINRSYPAARLGREDVLHYYGGLRPLVDTETKVAKIDADNSAYKASRASEVYDHEASGGLKGVLTAIGGKWTTSRALAEKVVDLCVEKSGVAAGPCATATTATHGGDTGPFLDFVQAAEARHPDLPPGLVRHLCDQFGTRMDDIVARGAARPDLLEPLSPCSFDTGAAILHAVENEMACTLEDALFRRTYLGAFGPPDDAVLDWVTAQMGELLGWDEARRQAEHAAVAAHYRAAPPPSTD